MGPMFDGPEPIYLQIAQMIRAQVLAGELAEEEQVMSTTQFATTFRINPATAAKAFAGLVDEGVLYKRRGLGIPTAEIVDYVLGRPRPAGTSGDQSTGPTTDPTPR